MNLKITEGLNLKKKILNIIKLALNFFLKFFVWKFPITLYISSIICISLFTWQNLIFITIFS